MNTLTIDAKVLDKIDQAIGLSPQERTALLGLSDPTYEGRPDYRRSEVLERTLVRVVELL